MMEIINLRLIFSLLFFEQQYLKISVYVLLEGNVSQILDYGPSFHFMAKSFCHFFQDEILHFIKYNII